MNDKLIIAIDGPVGSGKSTVARRVAEMLGYTHLDSGAMYRAVGLKALRYGVPLDSPEGLSELASAAADRFVPRDGKLLVLLDGEDVTGAIRTPEGFPRCIRGRGGAGRAASDGGRAAARGPATGGVVMEGRDIGSVVFPHADLKIFLDASAEVRRERRQRELEEKGEPLDLEKVLEEVHARDRREPRTGNVAARAGRGRRGGGQHGNGCRGNRASDCPAGEGKRRRPLQCDVMARDR